MLLLSLTALCQAPCQLDQTFATNGKLVLHNGRSAEAIALQDDGKLVLALNYFGSYTLQISRFDPNGNLDQSFGTAGIVTLDIGDDATKAFSCLVYNSKIFIGGNAYDPGGARAFIAAMDLNGQMINSFGTNGIIKFDFNPKINTFSDMIVDANGNIYILGNESYNVGCILKLDANTGNLVSSFDNDGFVTFNYPSGISYELNDINLDNNGDVLIAGTRKLSSSATDYSQLLVKVNGSSGSFVNSFGSNGVGYYQYSTTVPVHAHHVLIDDQNNYFLSGYAYENNDFDILVAKVNPTNGTLNTSFGNNGFVKHDILGQSVDEIPYSALILPDNRMLLGGHLGDSNNDTTYFALFMLNPDGTRDLNFAPNAYLRHSFDLYSASSASCMAVDLDNKEIFLGGFARTCSNGVCGLMKSGIANYTFEPGAALSTTSFSSQGLEIYPNPISAGATLFINSNDVLEATLQDLYGRIIDASFDQSNSSISIPTISDGLYILSCKNKNDQVMTKKILVSNN